MADVEKIKKESNQLRGSLRETLAGEASHFEEEDLQVMKFHGIYQQDDRDTRKAKIKAKEDRDWIFMVRSRIPGGALSAGQYLIHDRAASELANNTIRLTSRQGIQLHGVIKGNLKSVIQGINESGITTWNACGDCERNVMASPSPFDTPTHRKVQQLAGQVADALAVQSPAYSEIWLDGKKVPFENKPNDLYGETYLPRKFKTAFVIPPFNDVDIHTQDLGVVAIEEEGRLTGFTVLVGGGMGMTHSIEKTYPMLSRPLVFIKPEHLIDLAKAVVTVQRDFGNREDRKRARMKYTIEEMGFDRFKAEVLSRYKGPSEDPKPFELKTVSDRLGWHEQGNDKLFCCVWVEDGRIKDEGKRRYKTAFKTLAEKLNLPVRITPNCNLIFCDIDPSQKDEVQKILEEHGVLRTEDLTETRKTAMACVALPTCGLALAESERAFPGVMDQIDGILKELSLDKEPLLIRMTGCPNGCARPYNADIAFVGRAPRKYAMYVGGSHRGNRLAGLYEKMIKEDEIPEKVKTLLGDFSQNRQAGESFTDYWGRTQPNGESPSSGQFHVELAERKEKLARHGGSKGSCGE
jgi:sulfite reductase (ferredoxin)